ncbi:hypothetical protein CD798_08495 [Bacillaceae bacterium SAOS 7]|nr:hypothetical protein CD798_08495 [Bacillaceae bacterium SAOS 7]
MTNIVQENQTQVQIPTMVAEVPHPIQEQRPVQVQASISPEKVASKNKDGEVVFKKPYLFEGKEYNSIDLSGIDNLTGVDLLEADQIYSNTGQYSPMPEMTLNYTFVIATKVTKQPLEFFHQLPAKEALKVKNTVIRFLNN